MPTKARSCSWLCSLLCSTVVESSLPGECEPDVAASPDGLAESLVFLGGGDVADRGVEADFVVLGPDTVEFGGELAGVADGFQVWPFALDVWFASAFVSALGSVIRPRR